MIERAPKDILKKLLFFVQGTQGRASRDLLSFASTCKRIWQCAYEMDYTAPNRSIFTAIINYSTELYTNEPIYAQPATAFDFNGIAECWNKQKSNGFLNYQDCLASIPKDLKPSRYLIFEVRLPRQSLNDTTNTTRYEINTDPLCSTMITQVKLIYCPARPPFLSHEGGYDFDVNREKVLHPKDFDNTTFAEPQTPLINFPSKPK